MTESILYEGTIAGIVVSAQADSDQPTQRRASSDVQIAVSATGVLRLLDHVCGTCWQSIYGCLTVSDSLNGCWRPVCLVLATAALCDALVRSAGYRSSYLVTLANVWEDLSPEEITVDLGGGDCGDMRQDP